MNGNIISCLIDNKIKIWKKNNNNIYENIKILKNNNHISSILLLENVNILLSLGKDGTKFWKLNIYEMILY